MSETLKGVVKWFNDAKGFGFIEHTSGKDVFVHYSVIEADGFKTLKDGEQVEYEIKEGPKGLHALRVQRVVKTEIIEVGDADLANSDSSDSSSENDDDDDSEESSEQERMDA
jgi:cold shock protein